MIGKKTFEDIRTIAKTAKPLFGKAYYLIGGESNIDVQIIGEKVKRQLKILNKHSALVIVDYLQILGTPKRERLTSLMDKVDYNLHELQLLATDIEGPIVVTSSTTKGAIEQTRKTGTPGETKGKGSVNILFSCRMLFELIEGAEDDKAKIRDVELHVVKNSEGQKNFSIPMKYDYRYSTFKEDDI